MRYGWKIDEIRGKSSDIAKISDSNAQAKIWQDIYQTMLDDYTIQVDINDEAITKSQFIDAIQTFDIAEHTNQYSDIALYLGRLFCNTDLSLPDPELPEYQLETVVNHVKTFTRRNENGSHYYFKKIADSPTRIQRIKVSPFSTFLGKNYILHKSEFYILINSLHGVQDVITLLHESSHVENVLRTGTILTGPFRELSAITREHYGFDFMEAYEDKDAVHKARSISLNHYLARAVRLYETVTFLNDFSNSNKDLEYIEANFTKLSQNIDISSIYKVLTTSFNEDVEYALSLIASLDIYYNSKAEQAPFVVTLYQMGTRHLNYKVVDRVAQYLLELLYTKNNCKLKD